MFHTSLFSPKIARVVVEYTDKRTGARKRKEFTDNGPARAFYLRKYKEGAEPKIISATAR